MAEIPANFVDLSFDKTPFVAMLTVNIEHLVYVNALFDCNRQNIQSLPSDLIEYI